MCRSCPVCAFLRWSAFRRTPSSTRSLCHDPPLGRMLEDKPEQAREAPWFPTAKAFRPHFAFYPKCEMNTTGPKSQNHHSARAGATFPGWFFHWGLGGHKRVKGHSQFKLTV